MVEPRENCAVIENRRGYSISFRLVLVSALIIASGIIIYYLYVPDEDGLALSWDDSPPEFIQLMVDEQNFIDNMNLTHHEKIDIRFNFSDDSEIKEAYVNISSPSKMQQLLLNRTGDNFSFSYQLDEVGEYAFSPVLVDEHGNKANTTLKILSEDNPPIINSAGVTVREPMNQSVAAVPETPVTLWVNASDDTFDHQKPSVSVLVKNALRSYEVPLNYNGTLFVNRFNKTKVPGTYNVGFKAVDEVNQTATYNSSFSSVIDDLEMNQIIKGLEDDWLFDRNPFFWEYIKDGKLDEYEKNVLLESQELEELYPHVLRMPEVYTKEANLTDVIDYINAVERIKDKDSGAAQWILESGLFMEDKKFSEKEQKFINQSLNKKDLLRLYVSDFVMDGVQQNPHASININGKSNDWLEIKPLSIDKEGDSEFNISGTDVEAVYSAVDDENLYLMVKTYSKANPKNRYVFNIRSGVFNFHLQYEPDNSINLWINEEIHESHGISGVKGDVTEIKIPLSLLNYSSKMEIGSFVDYGDKGHADFTNSFDFQIKDDSQKIKEFKPKISGNLGYLSNDLTNLPEIITGINESEQEAINELARIVNASKDDYQLRKGVYLIDEYGVPDKNIFNFNVPQYNTQLQVLLHLAEDKDIPKDYYRMALACGIDYGSVVTIGDNEVDDAVRSYTSQIFDYIRETDEIIKQKGADWQAKGYPLEADIGLVWGAGGLHYPHEKGMPYAVWNWYKIYNDVKKTCMDLKDFNYLFTDIKTLKEMQKFMFKSFFVNDKPPAVNQDYKRYEKRYPFSYNDFIDRIAADLNDYIRYEYFEPASDAEKYMSVESKIIRCGGIWNADWQWDRLQQKGKFYGACMDNAQVQSAGMLKSINIASIIGEYPKHGLPLYFNSKSRSFQANPYEAEFRPEEWDVHPPDSPPYGYEYSRLPWDNYHLVHAQYDDARWRIAHSNDTDVFVSGFPLSYIYRKHWKIR